MKTPSRVTRLAGAILAETNGEYYLVGQLKEPCDFSRHGFETPDKTALDQKQPYVCLKTMALDTRQGPSHETTQDVVLLMDTQGQDLPKLLFKRFVIARNHSVSERLWRVMAASGSTQGCVDGRWLEQMPDDVWGIVRESVLKCL